MAIMRFMEAEYKPTSQLYSFTQRNENEADKELPSIPKLYKLVIFAVSAMSVAICLESGSFMVAFQLGLINLANTWAFYHMRKG